QLCVCASVFSPRCQSLSFPLPTPPPPPSTLFPYTTLFRSRIRMLILNAILLNVLAGAALFTLARMYERRIFIPAESDALRLEEQDRKSTRLNSSHVSISYAVFCLKKKKT